MLNKEDDTARLLSIRTAISIFGGLRGDPSQAARAYRGLGLCYFAWGDLTKGENDLARGIALTETIAELDELLKSDFKLLHDYSADWPQGQQLREALDRLRDSVAARRAELERITSASGELQHLIETFKSRESVDAWEWVGAHAGLARLHMDARQWQQAANVYNALLDGDDPNRKAHFPEVYRGAARAQAKLGLVAASNSDLRRTVEHFRRSLGFRAQAGLPHTPYDLVIEYAGLIYSIEQYNTLKEALVELSGVATTA
jgi:tetratricopeptide (TPR) repeat protein